MLKRLAAVLVAVALVAGAWWVRDRYLAGDADDSGPATTAAPAGPARLVCATEFAAVCQRLRSADLEVRVEPAGATRDRLGRSGSDVPDAWLTVDPWPAMLEDARDRAQQPPAFDPAERLASSPTALLVRADRRAGLEAACGGTLDWPCLGSGAISPLLLGMGSAADSAGGAVVYGNGVASLFPDLEPAGIATIDLQASDAFDPWSRAVGQAASDYADEPAAPLFDILTIPKADVVALVAAEFLGSGADPSRFTLLYPEPVARADAVLAVAEGARLPGDLADRLRDALQDSGWEAAADGPAPGLPSPGLTEALRTTWRETTR